MKKAKFLSVNKEMKRKSGKIIRIDAAVLMLTLLGLLTFNGVLSYFSCASNDDLDCSRITGHHHQDVEINKTGCRCCQEADLLVFESRCFCPISSADSCFLCQPPDVALSRQQESAQKKGQDTPIIKTVFDPSRCLYPQIVVSRYLHENAVRTSSVLLHLKSIVIIC